MATTQMPANKVEVTFNDSEEGSFVPKNSELISKKFWRDYEGRRK